MRERDIFIEAIAKDVAERAAYLAAACGDDPELRRRVEELLEQHEKDRTFFLDAGVRVASETPAIEAPGTLIGPYKLLQVIGEGGMGVVYMAEQLEPVQRKVALKVIKPGMDTRQVIARFEAERQALAVMDSPHIAKVLDAGTTTAGRPYFVMELVKGLPITKYCDEAQLSVRERLELFLPVCQAIQHAHQKGIIHRDIKPSNVMVALYDGRPVPKVIDFGVAKATGQRLTERTMFTEYGQIVGTLEYMSPEQANLNQYDIDTRSDIYSLGVLLYELLTGTTPFNQQRLRSAAFDEMLRIIREEEPQKPSTKLSASDTLPAVAANRNVEPARLSKLIRGDLDWIVMKALEKDRSRRYETANGLALDMQRYLADEPVQACPPSAWYRFRKFARRNKRMLATASLLLVMLVLGVGLLAYNNVQIQYEQNRTKDALGVAKDNLGLADENLGLALRALDEIYMKEIEKRVQLKRELTDADRQFLEEGLRFYEQFSQRNSTHAGLQSSTAKSNRRAGYLRMELSQWPEAEAHFRKATLLLEKLVVAEPKSAEPRQELASSKHGLAFSLRHAGELKEAEAICLQAIALWEHLVTEFPDDRDHRVRLGQSQWLLRDIQLETSRHSDAEQAARRALKIFGDLHAKFPEEPYYQQELALSNRLLSDCLYPDRRFAEMVDQRKVSVDLYADLAKRYPKNQFYRQEFAHTLVGLGYAFKEMGWITKAEAAFRLSIELHEALVSETPLAKSNDYRQRLAWSYNNLSMLLVENGRIPEAETYGRRALALHTELTVAEPSNPRNWLERAKQSLALARIVQAAPGRADEVRSAYAATAQTYRDALPYLEQRAARSPTFANRWEVADCLGWLGESQRLAGQNEAARLSWAASVPMMEQLARESNLKTYRSTLAARHDQLGNLYQTMGWINETEASFRQALALWTILAKEFPTPEHRASLVSSRNALAAILALQGKDAAAAEVASETDTIESRNSIAWRIVSHAGSHPRAAKLALGLVKDVPRTIKTRHIVNTLGVAYYRTGDYPAAIAALTQADDLCAGWSFSSNAFFLAMAHWQRGEQDLARAWYVPAWIWMRRNLPDNEELLRFRDEATALLGVPTTQYEHVQDDSAEFYSLVLVANPRSAWGYGGRGRVYYRARQYEQAAEDFNQAIELKPEYFLYWADRGTLRGDLGMFDEALDDLTNSLELNGSTAWVWSNRAQTYAKQSQWKEAVVDFTRALELDPSDAESWNRRGVAHNRLKLAEESAADYAKAVELKPNVALYWSNLADSNMRRKQYAEAIRAYSQVIELRPYDAEAWNGRGAAHSHLERNEQAFCDHSKAIDLQPRAALYWSNRGLVNVNLAQFELAIADYSRAIELDPDEAEYWNARGEVHATLGKPEPALDDFTKAIELAPDESLYVRNRGLLAAKHGKHEQALTDFSTLLEANPGNAESWNSRGNAHVRLFHHEQAYCDYSKAIDLQPQSALYWHNRGWASAQCGRYEPALADYTKALELQPSIGYYWSNRGVSHAELNQWDAAAADFARAIELQPTDALFRYRLGLVRLQQGDVAGYRALCRESLALGEKIPQDPSQSINWICVLEANAVTDWSMLLERTEKVVAANPNQYLALHHHGAALYRAGKFDEALACLNAAAAAYRAEDKQKYAIAYCWLFLSLTHHRLGHVEEARNSLTKAGEWLDQELRAKRDTPAVPNGFGWNRQLTFELLRREADALVGTANTPEQSSD